MTTAANEQTRYIIGAFTLDIGRGALLKDGVEIRLRPQSYAVLKILVEHNGNLVDRETLYQEVWGEKIVTDASLAQCLIDIRKAFADTQRTIIRTVPRRGFIFDAEVTVEEPVVAEGTSADRSVRNKAGVSRILGATIALLLLVLAVFFGNQLLESDPPARSIAVLPFIDLSEAQDLKPIGDGLSEDILNSIAKNPDLLVIARTSSFSIANDSPDIFDIRDALKVAYVLEGSIRSDDGDLVVIAQLIDSSDGSHVWSQSFKLSRGELQSVQHEIAEKILQSILRSDDDISVTGPRHNVSANQLMMLAREYEREVLDQQEVDIDALDEAIRLYREATLADPNSALAHSRLAGALLYKGDAIAAAPLIFKAMTIDPDISEVQDTQGKYLWRRRLTGAGTAWKRAIELNPNNADALNSYGYWLWVQGDAVSPDQYFRRALQLDPRSLIRYATYGNYLAHESRIDETDEIIARVQALFDSPASLRLIARLHDLTGRVDESIAWTIKARDLEPDNPTHVGALAELYADIGDSETALRLEGEPGVGLLTKLRRYQDVLDEGALLMIQHPDDIHLRYLQAWANLVTGNAANAVRLLEDTGLPGTVRPESRQILDIEAAVYLIDALNAAGETERSRELAEWWENRGHTESRNWWVHFYHACTLAVLDRTAESLAHLDLVRQSPRLPWDYLFRDARCLQRYADEPRYQAVLQDIEARQADLREKLPKTLEKYGLTL